MIPVLALLAAVMADTEVAAARFRYEPLVHHRKGSGIYYIGSYAESLVYLEIQAAHGGGFQLHLVSGGNGGRGTDLTLPLKPVGFWAARCTVSRSTALRWMKKLGDDPVSRQQLCVMMAAAREGLSRPKDNEWTRIPVQEELDDLHPDWRDAVPYPEDDSAFGGAA